MITNYREYILTEIVGINNDVIKISNEIYKDILNNVRIIIPSPNKLGIKRIRVNYINIDNDVIAQFNIDDSNNYTIDLTINNFYKINLDTIYHELNHVLQFLYKEKDNFLINVLKLQSLRLSLKIDEDTQNILNNYVFFKYLSSKDEIDSTIYSTYYQILMKKIPNIDFNRQFGTLLPRTLGYTHYEIVKNYNPDELRKLDHIILVKFINMVDENFKFLLKSNNINKNKDNLISILRNKYRNLFKNNDKHKNNIKVINVDDFINKVKNEKAKSEKYFLNKLTRLYSILK